MESRSSSEDSFELLDYEDEQPTTKAIVETPQKPELKICLKCREEIKKPVTIWISQFSTKARAQNRCSIVIDESLSDKELCQNCNLVEFLELDNEVLSENNFRLKADNEQITRKFACMSSMRDVDDVVPENERKGMLINPPRRLSAPTQDDAEISQLREELKAQAAAFRASVSGTNRPVTLTSSFPLMLDSSGGVVGTLGDTLNSSQAVIDLLSQLEIFQKARAQSELEYSFEFEHNPIVPVPRPKTVSELVAIGKTLREENMKLRDQSDQLSARFQELSFVERSKGDASQICNECNGPRFTADYYVCQTCNNKYRQWSENRKICGYCAYTGHSKLGHEILDLSLAMYANNDLPHDTDDSMNTFQLSSIISKQPFHKQVTYVMSSIKNLEKELNDMMIPKLFPIAGETPRLKKYLSKLIEEKAEYLRCILRKASKEAVADLKMPYLCDAVQKMKLSDQMDEIDPSVPSTSTGIRR